MPPFNTLLSCNINIEVRNMFFTIKKQMKEQIDTLVIGYMRVVDKSAAVVTILFVSSRETAKNINNVKSPSAETVLVLLFCNQNDNILVKLTDLNRNIH